MTTSTLHASIADAIARPAAGADLPLVLERGAPPDGAVCLLLHGALPPAACRAWIAAAEAHGYAATGGTYPPSYRDNDRLVLDDPAAADALLRRVRAHLPADLVRDGVTWTLAGLNPRFRGCRYRGGQRFGLHRDGPHTRDAAVRSWLTLMLYLNDADAFEGGATRFFADRDPATAPWLVVRPRAGTAIVFDHALWHDGEAVPRGTKYVLRTDVLYRREDPGPTGDAGARDGVRPAGARAGRGGRGRPSGAPATTAEGPAAQVLRGHAGYVWQVRRLPDAPDGAVRLASAGRDGTVRLWRASLDAVARAATRFDADGPFEPERVLRAHAESVTALALLPDGALWTGARDGALRAWAPCAPPSGGPGAGPGCAREAGPEGERARARADASAWSRAGEPGWRPAGEPAPADAAVLALAVVPGALAVVPGAAGAAAGACVAAGTADGRITLHDPRLDGARAATRAVAAHAGWVWALAVAPCGSLLSAGEDGAVRRWCARTLAPLETLRPPGPDPVRALVAQPCGRVVWGTASGALERSDGAAWPAHAGAVRALVALPGGALASGGEDDRVRVWSAAGAGPPSETATWAHDDFVTSLATWTVAGVPWLASASYDGTVRVRPVPPPR